MATLRKSKQRDFIKQIIVLGNDSRSEMVAQGLDPKEKLDSLEERYKVLMKALGEQEAAKVALRDATKRADATLKDAYSDASRFVNIMAGILGKKNSLVLKIRKLRK